MIFRFLITIILLWTLAFALACRLLSRAEFQGGGREGLTAQLLGELRFEIGGQCYEQADRVFHKGIGHYHPASFKDWFARLRQEVAPGGHVHLQAEDTLEIMPWLYFTTRADPQNVTAYAVAAFWLASSGKRPDLAEEVLNEALRNNPSDYRIYLEKGNLALRLGKYEQAARLLDAALVFYQRPCSEDKEQMRIDRAEILSLRGLLYEMKGETGDALRCFREVVKMFPGRLQLKERIVELEQKGRAATPPEQLFSIILFRHRHVCSESDREKNHEAKETDSGQ